MKTKFTILTAFAILFCVLNASAGDLNIFGFFQGQLSRYIATPAKSTDDLLHVENMNAGITQANLFLSKESDWGLTGFVNFEFVNNYSSDNKWGYFNLQEAFLKYDFNDNLAIKAGLLIPRFNAMYEIYNRTPLLPYLSRPMLYETQLGQVTNIFDVLPSRSLLQIMGNINVTDDIKLDIAGFFGNAPNSYIESPDNVFNPDYIPYGQNATIFSTVGGRIGMKWDKLSIGVSATYDKSNKRKFALDLDETKFGGFGDLDRIRLGADFSYKLGPVTLDAELLMSTTSLSQGQKDSLALWAAEPNSLVGKDFDVNCYFISLLSLVNMSKIRLSFRLSGITCPSNRPGYPNLTFNSLSKLSLIGSITTQEQLADE